MKVLSKPTTRMVLLLAAFASLAVGTATAVQQSEASIDMTKPPAVVTIVSCVNNATGAIRIVSNTTVCKSTEHKIEWNQKGARGPQGPQGLQGRQGSQGPTGSQGPPGISVGYSSVASEGITLTPFPGVLVAQSNPVATSGTYFVSASALLEIFTTDNSGATCHDTIASSGAPFQLSESTLNGEQQMSITDVITVRAGDFFQMFCTGSDEDSSLFRNGGLTASLINNASDASKKPRHPRESHFPSAPTHAQESSQSQDK